jgi:RNA polymerase sigma factor (TIGR02999 family)
MSSDPPADITRLLRELGDGRAGAIDDVLPVVYGELRRLADRQLRGERAGHTLSPTALVHEAYMHLIRDHDLSWESRAHFFGIAARAMRQVLVAHARRRAAGKRGGGWERVTLYTDATPHGSATDERSFELLDVHDALERLAELDERTARVVELRFFGGLTLEQSAHVLGVSRRTAADDWSLARAWLARELGAHEGD